MWSSLKKQILAATSAEAGDIEAGRRSAWVGERLQNNLLIPQSASAEPVLKPHGLKLSLAPPK